jgi:molybdopterin converting factor small subunit
MRYRPGEDVARVLKRLVEYAPALCEMLFEKNWQSEMNEQDLWMRVEPVYVLRGNWRVLLNGQDLRYYGGFERGLKEGDTLDLFPPGR